jgi:hypothetical protein
VKTFLKRVATQDYCRQRRFFQIVSVAVSAVLLPCRFGLRSSILSETLFQNQKAKSNSMVKRDTKRPTGPTRDPMEVGLARHRKDKARELPVWMEEYGSWLIIGALVLFVVLGAGVFSLLAGPPPLPPAAQLVVSYGPVKVWGEGAGTRLNSVSLKVRNVGAVQAEGVTVALTVPGRSFPLTGPAVLAVGAESEFAGPINVTFAANEQLSIAVQCVNCRQ